MAENLRNHILIVSLPRSGSTVLTNMLDARKDILCLPECFFPAALEFVSDEEMRDREFLAGLFVESCTDGSPLTVDEARDCIMPTKVETLERIAETIASKYGRKPDESRIVVWKCTRMVGLWRFWTSVGGRFVILSRPPINVYESQFRVHFGLKNRNPARFALFEASYLAAFKEYPAERTFRLDYASIPDSIDILARWMGSRAGISDECRTGGVLSMSGRQYWHKNIGNAFQNKDEEKAANVNTWQRVMYVTAKFFLRRLGPVARLARTVADKRQMAALRGNAGKKKTLVPELARHE